MFLSQLNRVVGGNDLSENDATVAVGAIMDGRVSPAKIASFLTAMHIKGETIPEIVGCARAMRKRVVRIRAPRGVVLDTCGTGGDGCGTFNVSTITSLVVAAAGVTVAKHGNRAASSQCGSADLLEALGVKIELPKKRLEQMLRTVGIAYLHAPALHPAMKYAGPVRRELGFRTIFNLLGPLCNPAFANSQIIGIFDPTWVRPFAEVLKKLGSRAVFTFHGAGGLDELSTLGPNHAVRLFRGKISKVTISPSSVGLRRARMADLLGGSPATNAAIARSVFRGTKGPYRDAVVINAAVALVAAGKVRLPREGARLVEDLLDRGVVQKKVDEFVAATQGRT